MAAQGILITLPLYVRHDIGIGREAVAFLILPGIVGALFGLVWTGGMLTPKRARSIMRLCLLGLIVGVFALASLDYGITAVFEFSQIPPLVHFSVALNTTYIIALPVAFILGTALSASVVAARVVLTETAPIGQQSRIFAVQSTLTVRRRCPAVAAARRRRPVRGRAPNASPRSASSPHSPSSPWNIRASVRRRARRRSPSKPQARPPRWPATPLRHARMTPFADTNVSGLVSMSVQPEHARVVIKDWHAHHDLGDRHSHDGSSDWPVSSIVSQTGAVVTIPRK